MLLWQKKNTQQEKEPRTSTHKPDGMETYLNLDKVKIEKRKTGKQVGQLKTVSFGEGIQSYRDDGHVMSFLHINTTNWSPLERKRPA